MNESFSVRDQRKPNHHWADNEVIDDFGKRIGMQGYAIYMFICRHAGNRDGRCYKTQAEIAKAFGSSPDTVQRHITTLLDCNLIAIETKKGKPSIYLVLKVPKNLPQNAVGRNIEATANRGNHLPQNAVGIPQSAATSPQNAAHNKEERLTSKLIQDLKREGNPHTDQKQANLDSWDLRRWHDEMEKTSPMGDRGNFHQESDDEWKARARRAAFNAGVSPERIVHLLKQHFPNDPNIDSLYQQKPLFVENA